MKALRLAIAIPGIAVLIWLGWTVIQVTRADELAHDHPEAALEIDPDHPQALLRLARQQLDAKDYDAATATARHVLRVEPGQGDAFAILALAAIGRGDANADEKVEIALQRAPRDIDVRTAALIAGLKNGEMVEAARQVDAILRLSPKRGEILFPAMATQTMVPAFREALLDRMALAPPWSRDFLDYVASKGSIEALERIYSGLQMRNLLSRQDLKYWLDRLLRAGEWAQARHRWTALGESDPGNGSIVYNGGFEKELSDLGFDWRQFRTPGVFFSIDEAEVGRIAHFHFIGRQAPGGNLRQPVIMQPGRYILSLVSRAESLRSEKGLNWVVRCERGPIIASIGPLEGSFDWRKWEQEFDVPESGCIGQWLELRNPAVSGGAQVVSGDLWIDDVEIEAL